MLAAASDIGGVAGIKNPLTTLSLLSPFITNKHHRDLCRHSWKNETSRNDRSITK
jgi:hypothetical protein